VLPRILDAARVKPDHLRTLSQTRIVVAFDETVTDDDLTDVVAAFAASYGRRCRGTARGVLAEPVRNSESLAAHHAVLHLIVFNTHHSETEMLRNLKRLENRDLLTAAIDFPWLMHDEAQCQTEMIPSPGRLQPPAPPAPRVPAQGVRDAVPPAREWLAEITGFAKVSLQPNAGSQGSLRAARDRAYHQHPR